uniref:Alternative protein USP40 n=1 Tax=Homo sapiens TaxID=9606 RepID=L8EAZ2_HUMAN|nr:alternative protein USP40 [Homo sapiens]
MMISVQSEMTLEKKSRNNGPWGEGKAKKPSMSRAATSSPVQRRLPGPEPRKLLSPSTWGASDNRAAARLYSR